MEPKLKVARQQLSVLELAGKPGFVSKAGRRRRMDRASFYEWKRWFQTHGIEGPNDLPPTAKSRPQAEKPELESRIIEPTLERKTDEEGIELSGDQVAYIEMLNPSFHERHVESFGPGELLSHGLFFVGISKDVGLVYMHTVNDTYGSLAFGFLHTTKQPEAVVAVVHNNVLQFHEEHGVTVKTILTDNGREYCGSETIPHELNDIEPGLLRSAGLSRAVMDEFYRIAFRQMPDETVAALQKDYDTSMHEYNYERPHLGYKNQVKRPWETIELFLYGSPGL